MRQLPQANFDQALSLVYEKMTNRPSRVLIESKSNDLTELVAHREHIADDLAGMGYEDDELVDFVETYIKAAIETVLDHPEWFRAEENAEQSVRDEIINAFEGDGEMDIYAFDDLARKYLGGGGEYDDMSQDDMVYRIGDEIGLDLEIRGDRVMLAGYIDSGEENAERESEERNRDIIARGGPGNALPTSRRLGQVDTSYKGANSERGTGSGSSKRPGRKNWRDELNRAAERKSRERNRDIIARGGPGDALPTDGRY